MINPLVLATALELDRLTAGVERDIKLRNQHKDKLRDLVRETNLKPGYYILSASQILRVPDDQQYRPEVLPAVTIVTGDPPPEAEELRNPMTGRS